MFAFLCEYEGARQSNPLGQFPSMEAVGPLAYEEALAYEERHRYEGCKTHSIIPIFGPEGMEA